jgi:hypothetical protein
MKVGDLIRYNAAGQRNKTLGLVLEMKEDILWGDQEVWILLIQWCAVGDLMPRKHQPQHGPYNYDIPFPGDLVWHIGGSWFEVVK